MSSLGYGNWISRDGKLIFLEKTARTVPYGFLSVAFSLYLRYLGFSLVQIGILLTLTILSSALYTFVISFVADRIGRRRTLVFFALTDFIAGALLFSSTAWWAPVLAGIVGNMTVGAGEVGPFLSLEQAMLPRTCESSRRTFAFSIYNFVGYGASAVGAGLEAMALGFRTNAKDDHDNMRLQFPAYDALHTYCKLKVEGKGKLEHAAR